MSADEVRRVVRAEHESGLAALHAANYGDAESAFRAALRAVGSMPPGLLPGPEICALRGDSLLNLARCRRQQGACSDAVQEATKASLLLQDNPLLQGAALAERGRAYVQLGRPSQAAPDLRRASQLASGRDSEAAARYAQEADAVECEISSPVTPVEAAPSGGASDYTGCKHYKRKCKMYCPTCSMLVPCRLCHDDTPGVNHSLDRHAVSKVQCQACGADQPPAANCGECGASWGEYYCDVCHLWRDLPKETAGSAAVWHCDRCGLCRIAQAGLGRDDYAHCSNCDSCWPKGNKDHKCCANSSKSNCPVCLEDLHTSRTAIEMVDCGHLLHSTCRRQLLQTGRICCPLCKKTICKAAFAAIAEEVRLNPMPPEFRESKAAILCNDCVVKRVVPLHWVAMQCPQCGGYNTTQMQTRELTEGELEEANAAAAAQGEEQAEAAAGLGEEEEEDEEEWETCDE
eukprot:Hpha_TRINITY_DN15018_c11_g9::TRINITY_DN15018_c11_g9_i1::g.124834::m.124834/K10144/RCHY1, PIRH2; RING finger and CHY zinc finger domain-containing protein 1